MYPHALTYGNIQEQTKTKQTIQNPKYSTNVYVDIKNSYLHSTLSLV